MLKDNIALIRSVLIISLLNFLFFHYPFFSYVFHNLNYKSFNGILLVVTLIILMVVANAFFYYLLFFISVRLGKFLAILFFIVNALAVYFVNTYGVIIDESMVGNVLNTKYEESVSFLSLKLFIYIIVLGILPGILIFKAKIVKDKLKRFFSVWRE